MQENVRKVYENLRKIEEKCRIIVENAEKLQKILEILFIKNYCTKIVGNARKVYENFR